MSVFGEIANLRLIRDMEGNSRCYAFVEYFSHQDFISAYKNGQGKKIMRRPITVDAEFGRLKPFFRPTRLGGGAGSRRRIKGARFQRSAYQPHEELQENQAQGFEPQELGPRRASPAFRRELEFRPISHADRTNGRMIAKGKLFPGFLPKFLMV